MKLLWSCTKSLPYVSRMKGQQRWNKHGCPLINTLSYRMKINIGLFANFPFSFSPRLQGQVVAAGQLEALVFSDCSRSKQTLRYCRSEARLAQRLPMKERAFYQKLERSLVHRLFVDGLLFDKCVPILNSLFPVEFSFLNYLNPLRSLS